MDNDPYLVWFSLLFPAGRKRPSSHLDSTTLGALEMQGVTVLLSAGHVPLVTH